MRITTTARHCEISEELRERARALLERLSRVAPRSQDASALFGKDHGAPTVEVRLRTARGGVHVGSASGADHHSALDAAVAKVRRQLDKAGVRRGRPSVREPR